MIPEMLCPTALIVNTFSDLTLLQVRYCTDWQFRSCQSEIYLIHKQGALESLEEAWLSIRWRLAELFSLHNPNDKHLPGIIFKDSEKNDGSKENLSFCSLDLI